MKDRILGRSVAERGPAKQLLAYVRELMVACPLSQCNPEECPLYALRKLPPRQRLRWVKTLPENDLAYLASYHCTCMATKIV